MDDHLLTKADPSVCFPNAGVLGLIGLSGHANGLSVASSKAVPMYYRLSRRKKRNVRRQ